MGREDKEFLAMLPRNYDKFITRAQAKSVIKKSYPQYDFEEMISWLDQGKSLLLPTGAKIVKTKREGRVKYLLSSYHHSGEDVKLNPIGRNSQKSKRVYFYTSPIRGKRLKVPSYVILDVDKNQGDAAKYIAESIARKNNLHVCYVSYRGVEESEGIPAFVVYNVLFTTPTPSGGYIDASEIFLTVPIL